MTDGMSKTMRVAAVQTAPVFGDVDATIDKVERLVAEASSDGARLVAFGESFIAGYPIWALVNRPVDLHPFFERHFQNSIEVPSAATDRLASIAAKYEVMLSIGINERSAVTHGTMWNSNLIFSPSGRLVNHRRKLVGTYMERVVFSPGDGFDLEPTDLDGVGVGALICGENTNTLARFALLAQGEKVHIATYPPAGVFERNAENFDMADAIRIRAAAHSFEGKVFTIAVATLPDDDAISMSTLDEESRKLATDVPPSASMIIGPRGEVLAGPLVGVEGIVTADIDFASALAPKLMHDIVGAYNRFDVFDVSISKRRYVPLRMEGLAPEPNRGERVLARSETSLAAGTATDPLEQMHPSKRLTAASGGGNS